MGRLMAGLSYHEEGYDASLAPISEKLSVIVTARDPGRGTGDMGAVALPFGWHGRSPVCRPLCPRPFRCLMF